MNSQLKRIYPFEASPVSEADAHPLSGISQPSNHKKMSITAPTASYVPGSPRRWAANAVPATKRDSYDNYSSYMQSVSAPVENVKKSSSQPAQRGRRNMKNLQLVVPPVRSSISAPSSPQLPPNSGTHTHNRRPSTPICVYQNKPSEHSIHSNPAADPMALISRTENEIGEDLPYKEEPICILPNLYLGTELNAANRTMINRLNIEYILNVGKEVEEPYMDEISGLSSSATNNIYVDNQISPGLSTSSSVSSDHSYQTATSSPIASSLNLDSPLQPGSPYGLARTNSFKRTSLKASRSDSMSYQFAQGALASGIPLTVPAANGFKSIKYKKYFWTHNQENLIADFIPAFAFIDEARSVGKTILVHCQCGVSRSASLLIGYVMKTNRLTLNQAYEFVKDRSPYISPNMSLVYQLVDFEKTLKLGGNNTPTRSGSESVKSHSRSSSIESDLLLKSHRHSASLSRSNSIGNTVSSYVIDSPPRTPGLAAVASGDNLLSVNQQQATVKGGPGRFHVITASPISPSLTASPSTDSLSPTSSASSPTTPPSGPTSSPTLHSRRTSKLPPLSEKKSSSSLMVPSSHNSQPRSPPSPAESNSFPGLNSPMSPTFPATKPSVASFNSTSSISVFPDVDVNQQNLYLFANPSHRSSAISINSKHSDMEIMGGQAPSIFNSSGLDSIFSPTRAASPITTPSFADLLGDKK